MKACFFIFFLLIFNGFAQDFKSYYWGDASDDIKSTEKATFVKDLTDIFGDYSLEYKTSVHGCKVELIYHFNKRHKLESVLYAILYKESNYSYNEILNKFNNSLINKYGKPTNKAGRTRAPDVIDITWLMSNTVITLSYETELERKSSPLLCIKYCSKKVYENDL